MHYPANSPSHPRSWGPERPYNELPLLPPTGELERPVVLKQCIEARGAVAELKQAGELIPNQAILINTRPLLEAKSSSEIENIVTTTDRLFQHRASDEHADPATEEALRYGQALVEGFQSLATHSLTTRTAEQICSQTEGRAVLPRHAAYPAFSLRGVRQRDKSSQPESATFRGVGPVADANLRC